jgi:FtsH-binding integral membrane protein
MSGDFLCFRGSVFQQEALHPLRYYQSSANDRDRAKEGNMPAALIRRQNRKAGEIDTSTLTSGYFQLADVRLFGGVAFLDLCLGVALGFAAVSMDANKVVVLAVASGIALVIGMYLFFVRSASFVLTLLFSVALGTVLGVFASIAVDDTAGVEEIRGVPEAIFAAISVLGAYFIVLFLVHRTKSFAMRMLILFLSGAAVFAIVNFGFMLNGAHLYTTYAHPLAFFSPVSIVTLLILSLILARDSFAIQETEREGRRREVAPMVAFSLMLAPIWIFITFIRALLYMFNNSENIPGPYI